MPSLRLNTWQRLRPQKWPVLVRSAAKLYLHDAFAWLEEKRGAQNILFVSSIFALALARA